jgi:hypothetical protein
MTLQGFPVKDADGLLPAKAGSLRKINNHRALAVADNIEWILVDTCCI